MIRVLHDILYNAAKKYPIKEAVFYKDQTINYQDVLKRSQNLGLFLIKCGVNKGDRVAFLLEKRIEKVISIFGISISGAIIVPVRKLLHSHQIIHVLNNSDSKVLITTIDHLSNIKDIFKNLPSLKTIIVINKPSSNNELSIKNLKVIDWMNAVNRDNSEHTELPTIIETDISIILYTSGSTGNPKGVVLSHLNVIAGAKKVSEYLRLSKNDRLLSILTFAFDYGLNQLTSAFLVGAQIVLLDYLFPNDIIKAIQKYKITGLAAVSTTWIQLLQVRWNEKSLPSLRYITNSGGSIPEYYVRELRNRIPRVSIYLMYGLTEAFRSTFLDPELVNEKPTSIGKAIPGEEIIILDVNNKPVEPGKIGELVHRGVLVAQGYWKDPGMTALRFRPNPLQPEEIPIKENVVFSGDFVKIDYEGYLYFIGRKDEMIKCAGNRISPTEIEDILYNSGFIQDAIVIGVPHEVYGQIVKAIVVKRKSSNVNKERLINYCKSILPPYMVPHEIEFREELPKNANGKLNRALIKNE